MAKSVSLSPKPAWSEPMAICMSYLFQDSVGLIFAASSPGGQLPLYASTLHAVGATDWLLWCPLCQLCGAIVPPAVGSRDCFTINQDTAGSEPLADPKG